MTYPFNDDHLMIAETVKAAATDWFDGGKGPERVSLSGQPFDPAAWDLFAKELGLAGINIPEDQGGAALGDLGTVAVMEALGSGVVSIPFLTTTGIVSYLLSAHGAGGDYLNRMASGEIIVTYCDGHDAFTEQNGKLSGTIRNIVDIDCASHILLTYRERERFGLALIDLSQDGVTVTPKATMDPTRGFGDLSLSDCAFDVAGSLSSSEHEQAIARSWIALAAECVGGAQACLNMTVEYAQQRVQFDRPIASFQAVKHRCADMFIKLEEARSAVLAAATADKGDKAESCWIAKAVATENYFWIAGSAIQMHGGIGFTWEYPLHFYFKRARANRAMFGSAQVAWDKVADFALGTAA